MASTQRDSGAELLSEQELLGLLDEDLLSEVFANDPEVQQAHSFLASRSQSQAPVRRVRQRISQPRPRRQQGAAPRNLSSCRSHWAAGVLQMKAAQTLQSTSRLPLKLCLADAEAMQKSWPIGSETGRSSAPSCSGSELSALQCPAVLDCAVLGEGSCCTLH